MPHLATLRRATLLPMLVVAIAVALAMPAHADEIDLVDLQTGERSTMRVAEVVAETWSKVSFRRKRKGRGPVEEVDTLRVLDVRRTGNNDRMDSVVGALRQGNHREALDLAKSLASGGWTTTADEDGAQKRIFVPFNQGDPKGRNKRPDWKSEYGHFLLAKSLVRLGIEREDEDLLKQAVIALDDVEVAGADGAKSGGFLGRFADGNSRFAAEAMSLLAEARVGLGEHDAARALYEDLRRHAQTVPLDPRWAYEAAVGPGRIAESKNDLKGAVSAYQKAASSLLVSLKGTSHPILLGQLGAYFARARAQGIRVKLQSAEKSGNAGAFTQFAAELSLETPDKLRAKYQSLPPAVRQAILVGAQDPEVRAITSIGLGLSNLKTGKHEKAVLAFREVIVLHFGDPERVAQAYHYLAQAAAGAAKKANGKAKALYEEYEAEAKEALKTTFRDSEWAKK